MVLQLEELGDFGVAQVAAGAGFVQQVNRLVRQVAVGDIPLRQLHHAGNNRVRHTDAVVLFIIPAHAAQHLDAVMDRRFFHLDRLEPAFQGGILFDKLAVFAEGGGADHLHLPAGKRGFHDVGGVHRAVRIAGADNVVDLVNKKDHVAGGLDLAQQPLDPLFKLAAELGAGHKGGQVQQVDFLVLQPGGHLAFGNTLGDAFGNGGFAHAGFADQAGVVFLPAAKDLQGAVDFAVAANDVVGLAVAGFLGQVFTVGIQILAAGGLLLFAVALLVLLGVAFRPLRAEAEREGRAAAGDKLILPILIDRGQGARSAGFLQEAGHALLHIFKILVRHTKTLHQVVNRFDVQRLCAGQAVAFLNGLAVFHALYKHHCGTFFAADTKHRIHLSNS